jgi:cell surface protein SprA
VQLKRSNYVYLITVFAFISVNPFISVRAQDTGAVYGRILQETGIDSLPRIQAFPVVSFPFQVYPGSAYYIKLAEEGTKIVMDSSKTYLSRHYLYNLSVALPYLMNFRQFSERQKEDAEQTNWQQIIQQYQNAAEEPNGLLNFEFDIPAEKESAFSTIFGKNKVDIKINGIANLGVGASIIKNRNPQIPPDQQTQINPTFNQNLKLNLQGQIGDKLFIRTNWDTHAAFNFQNRVNILYKGYKNEILQRVQIGNVSMESGNSLIGGSKALFGVKADAQFGPLELTTVFSQQNGQSNTQTITGGAEKRNIHLRPADYEYDTNFFLDFYLRQQFEQNMSDPQKPGQSLQLSEVKVWVLRQSRQSTEGERKAIALLPLGDVQNADSSYLPPDGKKDGFPDSLLNKYRDPSVGASASDFGVNSPEFVEGYFIPLLQGKDYKVNRALGFITIKKHLSSRQAVAVSFKYIDPQTGQTISVGDVGQSGDNRIFLKLIRPETITTSNPAWELMMKNIYNLGVKNVTPDGLDVDIKYTEQNVPSSSLPGRNRPLLQDLGLDRVNEQGAVSPDNHIDFGTGTLNAAAGRIIFPYLHPFGNHLKTLLQQAGTSQTRIHELAFAELYHQTKPNARQNTKNNYYLIQGASKGSVSDHYSLGLSPVRGSVHVFANGTELQKGVDYRVDYSIGSVTILNDRYLHKGQQIQIKYEKNELNRIKQKTLTGVRADYTLSKHIHLGSTYMHLKERPNQDKIRLGNEAINNTILGLNLDAAYDLPWLTRFLDKFPLLQTKEPSQVSFSGEFAQLRPGVVHTNAVGRAIKNHRLSGDQKNGLSYIDDFEGDNINLTFLRPSRWHLAAAPAAVPGYQPDEPYFSSHPPQSLNENLSDAVKRSDLRSQFSWYTVPRNITRILGNVPRTPETQPVKVTDVFPNRDILPEENYISTLDIHYNPEHRGQYNYNDQLKTLLDDHPERTWGGMTTTLPSGQQDLTQNNIEYISFWVEPILPDGKPPTASDIQDYDGKLYVDLGEVSEDVIPNFKINTEDGLARNPDNLQKDHFGGNARSYIPVPAPPPEGQFSNDKRAKEDVGLDGAPDQEGIEEKNEQVLFSTFIQSMKGVYGANSTVFKKIKADPSNDDYVYYGEENLKGIPLQKRFYRMYGYTEGNTPPNISKKRAITNKPNSEGLINPSRVQTNNDYYEYEVDLNPAKINGVQPGTGVDFLVDKVPGSRQQDRWYHIQIPLQKFKRKFGDIHNFENISHIRVWMSGYKKPLTLRFASFKLIGNQWRYADKVDAEQNSSATLHISTINIEENSRRHPVPYRQPRGAVRAETRTRTKKLLSNEQSLVLDVSDLASKDLKMIRRTFPGGLNMTNYKHVRMYVHGEGYKNKEDLELVVRFGTDLINNYYEYRQPITPTDPNFPFSRKPLKELSNATRSEEGKQVWLYDKNTMHILLSAFKQLKQLRDQKGAKTNQRFERAGLMSDAVPGAVFAIKGNPSLGRVHVIGIGVQNPFDPAHASQGGKPLVDAEVWVDELRVSGFRNRKGWAAKGKAQLTLADFATLNVNLNKQTDGFGELNSRLGERGDADKLSYFINSTIHLDKLTPKRYGWNLPLAFSLHQSTSTPRFLPNAGDVTLTDFRRSVYARNDLTNSQKSALIKRRIRQSQLYNNTFSLSILNAGKSLSDHPFGRYILDHTTLDYVYNRGNNHNPQYASKNSWNYHGSLSYRYQFKKTRLFRPFNFLRDVPILQTLAGLNLGYNPSSIKASAGIDRSYEEQQRRSLNFSRSDSLRNAQEYPLQQTHSFTYHTNLGFKYNLTPSIKTFFQSLSVFDLSTAGIRYNDGTGAADSSQFSVAPTFTVLKNLLTGSISSRRRNYKELYSANWRPELHDIEPLHWIDYSASYSGGFQWRNSPLGSHLGATVTNNLLLNQSFTLHIGNVLDGASWYQQLRKKSSSSVLGNIFNRVLKSIFSLQSIEGSFNISTQSLQTGYAGNAPFFDQFGTAGSHFSPAFSYRTGFTNQINLNQLIENNDQNRSLQLPSNHSLGDKASLVMHFTPFENFHVDLSWSNQWSKTYTRNVTLYPDQSRQFIHNQTGNVISGVWAFGGGYESLLKNQLDIAEQDINAGSNILSDSTGNRDGLSVMGDQSLQKSFREAYLSGFTGGIGSLGFTPFPLPGWRIVWSGLEKTFPFLSRFVQHASLLNIYTGRYRLDYNFNAHPELLSPLLLGDFTVQNRQPVYEPTTINIEKRFSPLIGLNITWLSGLHTNLKYNISDLTSLALSNATVIEQHSGGFQLTVNYSLHHFKIPLFSRINNAVDLTLNAGYYQDVEKKYMLSSDLDRALQSYSGPGGSDDVDYSSSFTSGQNRINTSAIIGYHFSQAVRANVEYDYKHLMPKSTGIFPRTEQDIKFNVTVSIQSD